jgi:hypothetical protein
LNERIRLPLPSLALQLRFPRLMPTFGQG